MYTVYCFLFHGFCLEFAWIYHILKPITTIALEERILQVNVGFVWVRPPLFKHHNISLWPLPALLPKDTGTWGKSSFWRWQQGPPFSKFQNTSNLKTYILVNTCHKLTANQTAHGFPVLVFFRPPRLSLSVGQKASMDHTAGQMQCFKVATNRNPVCVCPDSAPWFSRICLNQFCLRISSYHWTFITINSNTQQCCPALAMSQARKQVAGFLPQVDFLCGAQECRANSLGAFWGWLISAIRTNVSHFLCDHGPSWKQNFQVHHPSVHERLVTQFLRRDLIHEHRPTLPSVLSPIDICRKTCYTRILGLLGLGLQRPGVIHQRKDFHGGRHIVLCDAHFARITLAWALQS